MSPAELPKVELHLHLDCSLSYRAVSRLAPEVTREEFDCEYVAPARCASLAAFLERTPRTLRLLQDEAGLKLAVEDLFEQLQADHVIYTELRFAPLLHTERGLTASRAIEIVERAVDAASRATGVDCRLILCTLRHFPEARSLETARLAAAYRGPRVVALDLAGDEAGFPIEPHVKAFEYARQHGLRITAHAGEASGPESVWQALRVLGPDRIGHGVRSIEDPKLLEHLRDRRIHLEICPSANVQIVPSIPTLEEHPLDKLYRARIRLNVNTDARTPTPTTLTREYQEAERVFGWGPREFLDTNRMAVEAAFLDDGAKARLRRNLVQAYSANRNTPTSI